MYNFSQASNSASRNRKTKMSASIFVNGASYDVVGDGMAPGTKPGGWMRDERFPVPFGGFGYMTLKGDALPDSDVQDVENILQAMYGEPGSNPEEEGQD
jgi:hypothetical protein